MSWIAATGQRWKLQVFFALMFLAFVGIFGLFASFGTGSEARTWIFFIATVCQHVARELPGRPLLCVDLEGGPVDRVTAERPIFWFRNQQTAPAPFHHKSVIAPAADFQMRGTKDV